METRPASPARERPFRWGLWALGGIVVWIVAMVALGSPELAILAPAAGVVGGWLVGGIIYLALSPFRR